jgi:branched-chain amino acid transport system ATP-binding protein
VPQDFRVFPEFTVLENLEIGFLDRKPEGPILEAVFEVFPVLKERKRQLSGTLSGGEKQMLAIGRALVKEPRLLILDEPTEGLMPSLVTKVEEVLEKIRGRGVAILIAEQNVEVALRVCDRIYVMEKGEIVYEGTSRGAAGKVESFLEVGG